MLFDINDDAPCVLTEPGDDAIEARRRLRLLARWCFKGEAINRRTKRWRVYVAFHIAEYGRKPPEAVFARK
jgi:hypothetical protein